MAAALVAEASNVGLRPVLKAGVPALTRGRLSHVDQNTSGPRPLGLPTRWLIDAQAEVAFARALGGAVVERGRAPFRGARHHGQRHPIATSGCAVA